MSILVAIIGQRFGVGRPFKLDPAVAIQTAYGDAVRRAGGLPVVLTPDALTDHEADDAMESISALVLTGGPDVVPARYQQLPVPEVYGTSELQDAFEATMLHAAIRRRRPVLAICRGMQLLNVEFGGTLHQHITGTTGIGTHGIPNGGGGSRNEFAIDDGTLAARVLAADGAFDVTGDETVIAAGMCHHHQAVDRVGDGLRVTGRCISDGVVEVIEPEDPDHSWLLGVQWHPEETAADDPVNQRLFDELVHAAR